jgi:hypothetical protein
MVNVRDWQPPPFVPRYEDLLARVRELEAELREANVELDVLRELAGDKCSIQKVRDALGPLSLWSNNALEKYISQRIADFTAQRGTEHGS